MKQLRIGDGITLPLDAITQTFAILAVRGAGKSNLAAVMAEEMAVAGLPFVVIDPVGSWYGLRSSADGKGAGLPTPIFGGRFGDVPLEKHAGALIADLVVADRLSCVIDVSEFGENEKITFLTDFAERLYRTNREPLHLFLEEADDYVPQKPGPQRLRCLGAFENIVRRGRARGLGITMITQRSAVIAKNVLTQIETLFVLRTTSPQDRKAVSAWVEYHGQAKELLESLSGLEAGEAWVWSPSWLGITKRIRVRRRSTFDSGATPKNVHGSRPPATLADVDLAAVKVRMAETIERAKETDPKELRKRIVELERQVKAKPQQVDRSTLVKITASTQAAATNQARAEWSSRVKVLEDKLRTVQADVGRIGKLFARAFAIHEQIAGELLKLDATPIALPAAVQSVRAAPALPAAPRQTQVNLGPTRTTVKNDSDLGKGERAILTVLAQYPGGKGRRSLGTLSGYSSNGGSFGTYLSRLRGKGYIDGSDPVRITEAGLEALGEFDPLPRGEELQRYWLDRLGKGEASILRVLIDQYPNVVQREELGRLAGYEASGGSFGTYLSRLRTKELIDDRELRATEALFD